MSSTDSISYSSYLASLYYDRKHGGTSTESASKTGAAQGSGAGTAEGAGNSAPNVDLSEVGSATRETEVNAAYSDKNGSSLDLIDSFDNGGEVWAGLDGSSTTNGPVVYVEVIEQGAQRAFLVEINKISLSTMTAVEAYALTRFVGGNILESESAGGVTASDILGGATSGLDAATKAKLFIADANYMNAVKNDIYNYQRGLDAASQNFQNSLLEAIGKTGGTSALDKLFL
ncbi:MAG: hypothetical protein LBT23_03275 [Synergistaceae bacterium]|jgi:hypothetical protein|nr:hypothetical protein [Synergistaceae bacterium]